MYEVIVNIILYYMCFNIAIILHFIFNLQQINSYNLSSWREP